jgi:hypothetical protein
MKIARIEVDIVTRYTKLFILEVKLFMYPSKLFVLALENTNPFPSQTMNATP